MANVWIIGRIGGDSLQVLHGIFNIPSLKLDEGETIAGIYHVLSFWILLHVGLQSLTCIDRVILIEINEGDAVLGIVFIRSIGKLIDEQLESRAGIVEALHFKKYIATQEAEALFIGFGEAFGFIESVGSLLKLAIFIGQHAEHFGDGAKIIAIWEVGDVFLTKLAGSFNALELGIGNDHAEHAAITLWKVFEIFDDHVKGQDRLPLTGHFIIATAEAVVERGVVVRALFQFLKEAIVHLQFIFKLFFGTFNRTFTWVFQAKLKLGDDILLQARDFILFADQLISAKRLTEAFLLQHLVAELQINVIHLGNVITATGKAFDIFHQLTSFIQLAFGYIKISGHHGCLNPFGAAGAVCYD